MPLKLSTGKFVHTIIWIFIHEEPIILNWLHYMPSKFHFRCISVMSILLFEERIKFNSENWEYFFWICDNERWNLRSDLIINWSKIMGKKAEDLEIFLFQIGNIYIELCVYHSFDSINFHDQYYRARNLHLEHQIAFHGRKWKFDLKPRLALFNSIINFIRYI